MQKQLPKIIVVCGPTGSGKTALALALAKEFNGAIISADSRQVYQEMNIGTAKEPGVWQKGAYIIQGIPHYLIDIINPRESFSTAEFVDQSKKLIKKILKNGQQVLVVGGTGLYIDSLINNFKIPQVPTNLTLRASLEEKSLSDLQALLKKLDLATYQKIDLKNKRRLSRALEVVIETGESFSAQQKKGEPLFEVLYLAIDLPREVLYDKINKRVEEQIDQGLVKEVEGLLQKYGWAVPGMSGIGYRQFKDYFSGKASLAEAVAKLKQDTRQYAKRQLTWFKRNTNIHWCKNLKEAEKLVKNFLK